jgi:hypothetical protein
MSYLFVSSTNKLMNFSFSFLISIGSQFLLKAPGGFGPNPKKSPKTSLTFSYFCFLLLAILADVGISTSYPGERFKSSDNFL